MKKLSLSLVLLGGLFSSIASAAMHPMHSMKKMMPTYDHWYLRADVSDTNWRGNAGFINNQLPSGVNTDMIPYWNMTREGGLGLGLGMGLSHHLRADMTFHQTRFSTADAQNAFIRNAGTGDLSTRVRARTALANLYWDLGHFSKMLEKHRLQPYVGGGIGGSYNTMNGMTEYTPGTTNVISHIPGHSNWATAFQYGAGLAYNFHKSPLSLDFSYMYLDAGKAKSSGQMDVNSSSEEQLRNPSTMRLQGDRWMLGLRWCL